jgi:hypothetical protein
METLLTILLDLLPRGGRLARRVYRRLTFFWKDRRPPVDEKRAFNIAFSLLGGQIEQCIAFRSIDSNRTLIAAVRASKRPFKDIHVLEQVGLTFRKVWSLEEIFGPTGFAVEDVDGDGNKEVIFQEASYGTGGGTKTLFVYSHAKRQLARISEWLYWANAAGPVSPEVKIELEPARADDERFIAALEKYAVKSGFLAQKTVDFNDPKFAVARWHFENGERKEGSIKLHFYRGRPVYGASISQQLTGGGVEWLVFFKGPVFGYNEDRDQHFIAFSPAWTYNWIIAATYCCGALWFVRHNEEEPRLYRFRLQGAKGQLDSYPIPGRTVLFHKIECNPDGITVNDSIFMPFSEMQQSLS